MNQHFCSLGEKLAKNISVTGASLEQYIERRASTQVAFNPVTEEYVYRLI